MGELIKAGKIRYWGLSNENAFGVTKFVHACEKLGTHSIVREHITHACEKLGTHSIVREHIL